MLTVICVLKSGGLYNRHWVDKLRRGVERNLDIPYVFNCLSDVPVGCNRIPLKEGWPGWWSKLELFRPGVIDGPTLYLDLDTLVMGDLARFTELRAEFAMMRNFHRPEMPGSSVMWFREAAPAGVYERFAADPLGMMAYHKAHESGPYLGDQAFIWDSLDHDVSYIDDELPDLVRSYKKHCGAGVPPGAALVAFGGALKPSTVADPWVVQAWA